MILCPCFCNDTWWFYQFQYQNLDKVFIQCKQEQQHRPSLFFLPTQTQQIHRGLTVWLSCSDGRHVPSRWAKSWCWHKGEKQQSQEVKNGGIREIHHHPTSLTLCRAWPYQAAGLSEWPNQVVGRAARPSQVWVWTTSDSLVHLINVHKEQRGIEATIEPFHLCSF